MSDSLRKVYCNQDRQISILLAQATDLTAISALPSSHCERVWTDFSSFSARHGLDPWLASEGDLCIFILDRAKDTVSFAAVKGEFKSVLSIRKHSKSEVCNVPFPDLVVRGLMQAMETEELLQLPFDPEIVHVLLKHSPCVQGPASFLAQRQSSIICCLFWGMLFLTKLWL